VPDTPTPSSLDAAIQALKQAQQAEADAKATQEAIRKGLLPELQTLTELLGGGESSAEPAKPQPAPAPLSGVSLRSKLLVGVLAFALFADGAFRVWEHWPTSQPTPPAPTAFDPVAQGKAYGVELAAAHADALSAAATDIRGGKPLNDVKTATSKAFQVNREAAFDKRFVPQLDKIIPPDTATPTADQRTRYADLFDGIVKGLRSVK
jgi:hypothetical protein